MPRRTRHVSANGALRSCGAMVEGLKRQGQGPCGCLLKHKARDERESCPFGYWPTLEGGLIKSRRRFLVRSLAVVGTLLLLPGKLFAADSGVTRYISITACKDNGGTKTWVECSKGCGKKVGSVLKDKDDPNGHCYELGSNITPGDPGSDGKTAQPPDPGDVVTNAAWYRDCPSCENPQLYQLEECGNSSNTIITDAEHVSFGAGVTASSLDDFVYNNDPDPGHTNGTSNGKTVVVDDKCYKVSVVTSGTPTSVAVTANYSNCDGCKAPCTLPQGLSTSYQLEMEKYDCNAHTTFIRTAVLCIDPYNPTRWIGATGTNKCPLYGSQDVWLTLEECRWHIDFSSVASAYKSVGESPVGRYVSAVPCPNLKGFDIRNVRIS